jgi:hypothetical protein
MTALGYAELADLCGGRIGMRDTPCPSCGPDRDSPENRKRKVLRVWHREPGFATFVCARCGERGWAREDGAAPKPPKQERLRREANDRDSDDATQRIEIAMRLWGAAVPLPDTLAWKYFIERRELHIGLLDDDLRHALRWHAGINAIVALMTDPLTNESTGVHRTFVNPDGTKRERKMLGRQGVIRLSADDDVTDGLGVVEGLEDGLSVLLSGWAPVWCATSAGAIERFPVLPGIEALTIFADTDAPGMKAARACVERWTLAGREARLSHPKELADVA